jgi:hypothetical protein
MVLRPMYEREMAFGRSALVLRVTGSVSSMAVPPRSKWKHLAELELSHPKQM